MRTSLSSKGCEFPSCATEPGESARGSSNVTSLYGVRLLLPFYQTGSQFPKLGLTRCFVGLADVKMKALGWHAGLAFEGFLLPLFAVDAVGGAVGSISASSAAFRSKSGDTF